MRLRHAFEVAAPIEDVWALLMDLERAAACLPGAEVLDRSDGDSYKLRLRLTLGPISMAPVGRVRIAERDDLAHRAVFLATGEDRGAAQAHATLAADPAAVGTRVSVGGELPVPPAAGVVGEPIIANAAAALARAFAANVERVLAGATPERTDELPVSALAAEVVNARLRQVRPLIAAGVACALVGYALGVRRSRATRAAI